MVKFLIENWQLKLISLAIAVILWFFYAGVETKADYLPGDIPIKETNIPAGLYPTYDTKSVRIKVQAKKSVWASLSSSSILAQIDLSNFTQGTYEVPVQVASSVPNIEILEKSPQKILVRLDPIAEKKVSVASKIEGKPADGFAPKEPNLSLEEVVVKGPKESLGVLTQAVAIIKLNGESQKVVQNVEIVGLKNNGEIDKSLVFSPPDLTATIDIVKTNQSKILGIKPIIQGKPASGFYIQKINVVPLSVEVQGNPQIIDNLDNIPTLPISVDNTSKGIIKDINLDLPKGVTVKGNNKVSVEVVLDDTATDREVPVKIDFKTTANTKIDTFSPNSLKAAISGKIKDLSQVNSVSVLLDLSQKGAGQYSVEIKNSDFTLPSNISLLNYTPTAINVSVVSK